jgi:hypothetical protein
MLKMILLSIMNSLRLRHLPFFRFIIMVHKLLEDGAMLKKILNTARMLTVLTLVVLASCDDFFSTSWGAPREYDPSQITLTRQNLELWKKAAAGNPELAGVLVNKIISELDGKSGAEKAAFQSAGIGFAIEQSGMGVKILELAGSALSGIDREAGIKDLLLKVQGGLSSSKAAANNIAVIAGKSGIDAAGNVPVFPDNDPYGSTADPSNVGLAVIVLALAEIPNIDGSTNLNELSPNLLFNPGGNQAETQGKPTDNELALAAYLNLIASDTTGRFDRNPVTSGIKSAFLNSGN